MIDVMLKPEEQRCEDLEAMVEKLKAMTRKHRGLDTHPDGRVKSLSITKNQRGEPDLHSTKLNGEYREFWTVLHILSNRSIASPVAST